MAQGLSHRRDDLLDMMGARRGHFVLESGHHGDLWLDLDSLFVRPARLRPFVEVLAEPLSRHGIDAICGPMVGGALIAQMIAVQLDVEFYFALRSPSTRTAALYPAEYRLVGMHNVAGKRTAVVDDVINAGSAVRATLTSLRTGGAQPAALGALLVLGERAASLAADQAIPLECIAPLDSPIWTPAECPLCASSTPLEDLGS